MAKRAGYLSPPRVMLLPCPAAHKVDLGRRGRPNAQASVGFVPGAKARSAHQSRGLASLVRVTWCFDCSPLGSAGSTGHAEAVVGFTCPKPAGRRCWVATAGDCTSPFRRAARPHLEAAVSRPAVVALLPSCRASASCRSPLRSPPSAANACAPFRLAAPAAITPQCLSAILLTRDHSVCRPPAGRPANQSPRDAPKSLSSPCRTVLLPSPFSPPSRSLCPGWVQWLRGGSLLANLNAPRCWPRRQHYFRLSLPQKPLRRVCLGW